MGLAIKIALLLIFVAVTALIVLLHCFLFAACRYDGLVAEERASPSRSAKNEDYDHCGRADRVAWRRRTLAGIAAWRRRSSGNMEQSGARTEAPLSTGDPGPCRPWRKRPRLRAR